MHQLVGRQAELEAVAAALGRVACRGIAIIGPAGAGKTRLAEEACRLAAAAGMEIVTTVVTSGSAGIPLGALAHLLPPAGSLDDVHADLQPAHLLRAVQEALADRAGRKPLVLTIDDAHHLDPISAHLIHQLAIRDAAFVVMTIRSGEAVPEAISALWNQRIVDRCDLGPLTHDECVAVAAAILGAPLDAGVVTWLWRTSAGNALYLRELVLGAREAGTLVLDPASGRWQFAGGEGHVSPRLIELVDHRLADLPADLRRAIDLVALAEPVGVALIEQITGLEPLAQLEERALIRIVHEQRRELVRTAHPLFGEALRSQPLTMRRRADVRSLADRVEEYGARRRDDAVRIAGWRLAAGGSVDAGVLLRAALAAQYSLDDAAAIRMCRLALEPAHGAPSTIDAELEAELRLCLGSALGRLGRFEEATTEIERATDLWPKPEFVARSAMRLGFAFGEFYEDLPLAEKVLRDALDLVPAESPWAIDLQLQLVLCRAEHGEGISSRAALDAFGVEPADPNQAATYYLATAAVALTTGRFEATVAVGNQGYAVHMSLPAADQTFHPISHHYNVVLASLAIGDLDACEELATATLDRAIDEGRPIARVAMSCVLATVALMRGQLGRARRLAAAAEAASGPHIQPYLLRWIGANHIRIHLAANEVATASSRLDGVMRGMPRHPVSLGGSPAWVAEMEVGAALGGGTQAIGAAVERGLDALVAGDRRGWLELVEAVLVQSPTAEAAQPFVSVSTDLVDGRRAQLVTRLVEVAADGRRDAAALGEIADGYRATGMRLVALRLTEHAVDWATRSGNDRLRTALAAKAAADLAACDGVVSWAAAGSSVVPLTSREREIAELVAVGRSSKAVAEQLYLSVRTVDNHLQRIYVKLGVSSRAELARMLGREP